MVNSFPAATATATAAAQAPSTASMGKKARAVVLAPMSQTAAKLLHQLVQDAADAAAPVPGTVTLAPHGVRCTQHSDSTSTYSYFDNYDTAIRLYRHHGHPTPFWTGNEQRVDANGRAWERRIHAVIDNFGDLVEVPA